MSKYIVLIIASAFFIITGFIALVMNVSINNSVIALETRVEEQQSAIDIQLQRRSDLILAIVDTVEASSDFEQETLQKVTEARAQASSGNVEQAALSINAVVEAYPNIKSTEGYVNLTRELAVTENLIADQRKTYNSTVREYKQFVRVFPNSLFLGGYEPIEADYLEFDTKEYDTNLFE